MKNGIITIPEMGEITSANAIQLLSGFILIIGEKIEDPDLYILMSEKTKNIFWSLCVQNKISYKIVRKMRCKLGLKNNQLIVSIIDINKGFLDIVKTE